MKTIRTSLYLLSIVSLSIVFTSVFGALHNQFSYSISNEFFRNFLFESFGVNEWNIKDERVLASIVGVLGAYWVGMLAGIVFAFVYLFLNAEQKLKKIVNAILITLIFSMLGSIIGLILGKYVPIENSKAFGDFRPINPRNYICADYMHTLSYYSGILGLIVGVSYLYKIHKK